MMRFDCVEFNSDSLRCFRVLRDYGSGYWGPGKRGFSRCVAFLAGFCQGVRWKSAHGSAPEYILPLAFQRYVCGVRAKPGEDRPWSRWIARNSIDERAAVADFWHLFDSWRALLDAQSSANLTPAMETVLETIRRDDSLAVGRSPCPFSALEANIRGREFGAVHDVHTAQPVNFGLPKDFGSFVEKHTRKQEPTWFVAVRSAASDEEESLRLFFSLVERYAQEAGIEA